MSGITTSPVHCPSCGVRLEPTLELCLSCGEPRPAGGWPAGIATEPLSPVELQLPRAVAPRIEEESIQLGAPPAGILQSDGAEEGEAGELLEFGEDSDPVGFVLPADDFTGEEAGPPKALKVRVVPAAGDQVDEPDVVVPLQAQAEPSGAPAALGVVLERGAIFASRYRVDEVLDELGGLRAYLAVQEPMVRRVHLCVLGDLGGGEAQQEIEARFLQESARLARRSHPNLAAVVDFGRSPDGACYLAAELMYGFSLRELMDRGPVEPDRLASILLDIARGLAACHDAGVAHRALWPAHVVLEALPGGGESMARLGGYGLGLVASMLDDPPSQQLANAVAPEVVQGAPYSLTSDVYAFGALAAQALLGRPLFGSEPDAVLRAHVEQPPPAELGEIASSRGLAGSIAGLALHCLSKEPDDRPASAAELVPLLEGLVVSAARPVVSATVGWRVLLAAALAGALLPTLLLASVGAWVLGRPAPPPEPVPVGITPDLAEVVEAQASRQVQDEMKSLREELAALESQLTEALSAAEEAREAEEAEPAPTPRPPPVERSLRPRPVPPPVVAQPEPDAAPVPEPVVVSEPEPVVVSEPEPDATHEPEPVVVSEPAPPPPPPPPPPHPAAASLDGLWLGTVAGRDLALDLVIGPQGGVSGSARIKRGGEVESAMVRGRVSEVDGAYQLELQVTEQDGTTSYSGRLEDGSIQGRVAEGGRSRGRWKVSR